MRRVRPHAQPLRGFLVGGDRRSIAQSHRALAIVRAAPVRVGELAALTRDSDWLVSQRALDLLEKLARERRECVEPHKSVFLGPLADSDKWEVRLQVVRALPLFQWASAERRRVVAILLRDVEHPQKFVRAWVLDGLAILSQTDATLGPIVRRHIRDFERSGSKTLQARAKNVRGRLAKSGSAKRG